MAKIKITQIRSLINKPAYQRKLVQALGIHKTYNSVIKDDTPSFRAIICRVQHLVKVESVNN